MKKYTMPKLNLYYFRIERIVAQTGSEPYTAELENWGNERSQIDVTKLRSILTYKFE